MQAHVVGYGSIDVLGNNSLSSFNRMLDDHDYIKQLDFMSDYPINRGYMVDDNCIEYPEGFKPRALTRAQKFAMHATNIAISHSKLPIKKDVAVIISSTLSEGEFVSTDFSKLLENRKVQPRRMINRITDMVTYHVVSHWGFHGMSTSVAAACATGLVGIDYAMRLLDEYEYVIVGSADAGCYPMALKGFTTIGAISADNKPFDDYRSGFVMGEGAGVLILQSEEKAKEYGSTSHAKLYTPGHASEGLHITSPAEDGRGAIQSITSALKNAGYPTVDAVCAHATSTPVGDVVEYSAIAKTLPDSVIWAPKSKVGHTIGGAGTLETIYCIESMKQGTVPHIQNLEICSFDTNNKLATLNQALPKKDKLVMINNSFGFGGKNMSQVIEVSV